MKPYADYLEAEPRPIGGTTIKDEDSQAGLVRRIRALETMIEDLRAEFAQHKRS